MPDPEPVRPVELEDLFRLKTITEAQLLPPGDAVVYVLSQIDAEKESVFSSLWLLSIEKGELKQLTFGSNRNWGIALSPDGNQIAFLSSRAEKPQLFILALDGGEARQLTHFKQGIGGNLAWSPDGRRIVFTAGPQEDPPDAAKPYRVDRAVYRFDGVGYLDGKVQDIYVIPAEGGDPKQLTRDRFNNDAPRWSPDSSRILYMPLANPETFNPGCAVLRTVSLEGEVRDILPGWGSFQNAAWMPDGKGILFSGQPHGLPIGSKNDLWLLDIEEKTPVCRTTGFKYGVGGGLRSDVPAGWKNIPRIHSDGKKALVNVQQGGTLQIYEIALEGKESWQPVVDGDRMAVLLDADDHQILCIENTFYNPCDLFLVEESGKQQTRLTSINEDLIQTWDLPTVKNLLFKGADGAQVEGWVMLPTQAQAPFPTVLYIHGGPHSAFGNAFNFDFLLLAAHGYATLFINHRASTGYGDEFSTAIKGDWGNLDYTDLMAGVDYAIEKGYCDADRLGCTGISGGGNLSCWIVGNTDRFKAAMPENPVTNWLSFYGTSDIGVWFAVEELGGHPHEIPEIYARCSPVTYAHKCTTPTLMVQGENDYRCPAEQSEQFYTILKANGCITEMLRFPNSFHGGAINGAIPIRLAHRQALLEWMDRYVLGITKSE
jgi:dipeptidyl aminopeptidase/acylaminoacyl peptidase